MSFSTEKVMILNIKVITRAKKSYIKEENGQVKVYTNAVPEKGKANEAVIKLLSEYYGAKKNGIRIVRGEKLKYKVVEIVKRQI